jgi:hypothetical protein
MGLGAKVHGLRNGSGPQLESGEHGLADDAAAGSRPSAALRRVRQARWVRRAAWPAAAAVTAVVLFLCALREARVLPVSSDGASDALQAWAMLHGNVLLSGWHLGDVSFYTTELPQYMLVESVRGLRPDVVHVCAALTYTLLVLLAAFVAKGRAPGLAGVARAAIAVGIMLAPSLSAAGHLLDVPDHTGSAVPVLAVLALLDWAGRRWYVPLLVGLALAWAVVGDPLVLLIGVVPVLVVCLARAGNRLVRLRHPLPDVRFELSLAVAAVAAAGAASAAVHVIRASGGYVLAGGVTQFVPSAALLPGNVAGTGQGILYLFSANFFGERFGPGLVVTGIHLIAVALVATGLWLAVRRYFWSADLAVAVLATAIIANVLAYLVTYRAALVYVHELAPVFSLGAALAGRVLAGPLLRNRLEPLLACWLACCVWTLGPPVLLAHPAPAEVKLAAWLEARHLHDGLTGYVLANKTTLESGGRVTMRAVVDLRCSGLTPLAWETDASLLNSRAYDVNFLLTDRKTITAGEGISEFGKPARVYHFHGYTVLAWRKNLLPQLNLRGLPALARTLYGGWANLIDVADPRCRVVRS